MAALSVDYRETVLARIQDSPAYAAGLLKSALEMMANGEEAEARETVKDLIHATGGFESMAEHLGINAKSLHRMLGPNGNPALAECQPFLANFPSGSYIAAPNCSSKLPRKSWLDIWDT